MPPPSLLLLPECRIGTEARNCDSIMGEIRDAVHNIDLCIAREGGLTRSKCADHLTGHVRNRVPSAPTTLTKAAERTEHHVLHCCQEQVQ